jgi:hypothetical protein
MNQALIEAITGEPVTVKLGKPGKQKEYPLAYPMQAVILYQKQTAILDRERAKNRPALTTEERRSKKSLWQKLMLEADQMRPPKGEAWDQGKFLEFDTLLDEAAELKITLDEDAGRGDSLYDRYNWRKMSSERDPERLLLALWVGLHTFTEENGKQFYKEAVTRHELGRLVDLQNADVVTVAIAKALQGHLIAPPEFEASEMEGADPNAQTPATPAA